MGLYDEPGWRQACETRLNSAAIEVVAAHHGDDVARAVVVAEDRALHARRLLERQLDGRALRRRALERLLVVAPAATAPRSWRRRSSRRSGAAFEWCAFATHTTSPARSTPTVALEQAAVRRVLRAVRPGPQEARGRQEVDVLADAHLRAAVGRRRPRRGRGRGGPRRAARRRSARRRAVETRRRPAPARCATGPRQPCRLSSLRVEKSTFSCAARSIHGTSVVSICRPPSRSFFSP